MAMERLKAIAEADDTTSRPKKSSKASGVIISREEMAARVDEIASADKIRLILDRVEIQMADAMKSLEGEAIVASQNAGDKLRFAEAIIARLIPKQMSELTNPDYATKIVCTAAMEYRTKQGEDPSQAELRKIMKETHDLAFEDIPWRRMLKKCGLNKLPTAAQKRAQQA